MELVSTFMQRISILIGLLAAGLSAAERPIDPTFLFQNLNETEFAAADETAPGCRYRPLFGEGARKTSVLGSVRRFGELEIAPGATCAKVSYPAEEQIYYVLSGAGEALYRGDPVPVRQDDFMYFAPGSEHGAANHSDQTLRIIVMGFKTPKDLPHGIPVKLPVANRAEATKQVVGNHPASTLYQLLLGGVDSQRDLLSVGHSVTSLYVMEFAPGGTNHPHHHPLDEEIYLVLDGEGEIVAGGGADGVAMRRPAKPGDAYFYRKNATVGFYSSSKPGAKAHLLAVRSRSIGR